MESEISERSLSMEKRENSLILETNAATDIYSHRYSSTSARHVGQAGKITVKKVHVALV